jgi:hypothetical protein
MSYKSKSGKPDYLELGTNQVVDGANIPLAVGSRAFDASEWPDASEVTFAVILSVSSDTLTGQARLYNLTDSEYVTGTTLTTSSTAPVKLESSVLTRGDGSGQLKLSEKQYEIRLEVTGGTESDIAYLGAGYLVID